ncbi:hypothetical protein [Meiothermus sp. Pnk-1]|uniref:hypothetical protein n=1 Tax=Meiothermus sp. Pnk-1 TaxID=873128 RepID=UPI0011B44F48|nr:hypothetical protein [Meiothermus sp. Pnk-1]
MPKSRTHPTLGPSAQVEGRTTVGATFDNLQNLNLPATPTGFTFNPSIAKIDFGDDCPNPLPSSIQVTLDATATVSDTDAQNNTRSATASVQGASFTVSVSGNTGTVGSIYNGLMTFPNLNTLLGILKDGSSNTATLEVTLTTQSALAGCTLTVTWGGGSAKLNF